MDKDKIDLEWEFWFNHSNNLKPSPRKKNEQRFESYYFIFDCFKNEMNFTSQSIKDILGINPEEFNIYYILHNIHPDDYEYVYDCERKSLDFCSSLYYNDNFRFNTTYSFRIKTNTGKYIRIRQQYQALEINEQGNMSKSLVMHIRVNDKEERSSDDFKIYDRLINKIVNINNIYNLTKRELEILDLVKKGYTSAQISEKLFLSKYTIDTHRKNILTKTKTSSFLELSNCIF